MKLKRKVSKKFIPTFRTFRGVESNRRALIASLAEEDMMKEETFPLITLYSYGDIFAHRAKEAFPELPDFTFEYWLAKRERDNWYPGKEYHVLDYLAKAAKFDNEPFYMYDYKTDTYKMDYSGFIPVGANIRIDSVRRAYRQAKREKGKSYLPNQWDDAWIYRPKFGK